MVEIIINENKLIFTAPFSGNYAGGSLEILLENITGVGIDPALARDFLRRRKFLSDFVPSVKRQGVFYEDVNCVYWQVQNSNKTIVISLQNKPHEKLIVEVENPQKAVEIIEEALKSKETDKEVLEEELTNEE